MINSTYCPIGLSDIKLLEFFVIAKKSSWLLGYK